MNDGEVCSGWIYAPSLNELYSATKGEGAYLKDSEGTKKLEVSKNDMSASLWITGFRAGAGKKSTKKNTPTLKMIPKVLWNSHGVRRNGSAALDLASIALGRADGYFELGSIHLWDVGAGLLLVTEAGGKGYVETKRGIMDGKNVKIIDYDISAIIATNGRPSLDNFIMKLFRNTVKK